ncbi:hypothetical protein ACJRO7_003197 [Eucalyptus globulus]|uniref:Uncharacterized protein n=1 Tax=Eucalyptus globulus TaxID=34317 RepID=A0ABD3ITK6_EUCGL
MDVKQVLFMSKGDGGHNYAQTSTYPQKIASLAKPKTASTVDSLLKEEGFFPRKHLNVADFGCASGLSTSTFMSTIIDSVQKKCAHSNGPTPEFQFFMNELPGNDFNTLFKSLSNFSQNYASLSCFIMGAAGSFHGRLFPRNSLHFAHSSYSVHWLSQVPNLMSEEGFHLSKGRIYISETSPGMVKEAYLAQVRADFSTFLKFRGEEMEFVNRDGYIFWEKLGEAIADLVSEGSIEEEQLDTLSVPHYTASLEEVQDIVNEEGFFKIEHLEIMKIDRYSLEEDPYSRGRIRMMATHIRSATGSIISHNLGEEIMDELYGKRLPVLMGEDLAKERWKGVSIIVVLKKHVP